MTDYTQEKTGRQLLLEKMISKAGRKLKKKIRKAGYMGNLSVCYTPKSEEDQATNIVEPSQSDVIRWLMTDTIDTPESAMDQADSVELLGASFEMLEGQKGTLRAAACMLERYWILLSKIERLGWPPMDAPGGTE